MTGAEIDAMLAADPTYQTVCDERRDAWLSDQLAGVVLPALPTELAWCGRDEELLDEVSL